MQRNVLTLWCITIALTATGIHAGKFSLHETIGWFLSQFASGQGPHASNAVIPDSSGPRLLDALWNVTEYDLASSRLNPGRTLQSTPGDEFHSNSGDPDPDPQPNLARRPLRNDDFIYVAPCTPPRLPLAQASRYWRKGMRAVFVMDQPADRLPEEVLANSARFRESFAWFPNFRRMANDKRDHYLEGDRRAAMTPVLAYASLVDPASMSPWTIRPSSTASNPTEAATAVQQQPKSSAGGDANSAGLSPKKRTLAAAGGTTNPSAASGSGGSAPDPFQWMLAGDDDTIFFMRGVKALLRDYDPQLPYFITDSMYIGSKSPQPGVWDFRCYPCHLQWGKWRRAARRLMGDDKANAPQPGKGCGCSTAELCRRRFPKNQTLCEQDWEGPVPFGGVGFIFSIGFFKHLARAQGGKGLRAYETCINAPETSVMSFPEGGDAFMSRCFWRLGFPITDPGYTQFGRYMGEILNLNNLYEAPVNLTRGALPKDALARWSMAVSMHLGARQQRSFRAAAMTVKYISGIYDLVSELLWPSARKS